MLALRDQENLAHAHQTAAAGKPLNQTIRGLQPKTPGNFKTPFRPSKNDENRPLEFKGQKTTLKNGPSKLEKNAFVTPLAPRSRAPLGQKTTNAKAHAFQTPAPAPLTIKPGKTVQKHSSTRRSARSKISIAQSEPVDADVLTKKQHEDEEPDFGYAPPPPVALPDPPLEINQDLLLDLSGDYCSAFGSPKDEHGASLRLRREEEEYQQYLKEQNRKILASLDKPLFPTANELNKQVDDMIAAGPKKKRPAHSRVDTMQAKSAAALLSDAQPRLPPTASRQTHASEQKQKGLLGLGRSKPALPPQPRSSSRAGYAALSKNTIGFPKAKKAPSIIPKGPQSQKGVAAYTSKAIKVDQAKIHPRDFRDLYGSPPAESDMWFRLKNYELLEKDLFQEDGDSLADELFEPDFFPFDNSKLDDEDFQLPMPE
ncbi:uncharacterized protein A1O9_11907 [Exophiala aquamarina CBS 119918]|uniref:Uncharacterized protein n=1 Tax=Exophiala aquamarina CBS 119918 TaxID=1182545 RepID=A0A072NY00_9EURO|nr:uncharacterized protein A1O9_11907 [Exophiala aquamarina CBS 119918]KEF51918.1 hypothetical protein A1O9_11907 [Exophiala aquamarina CBS 119918]